MDFKKSKKYTESYKTEFLNKLNEGKMVDVQEGQNLKVAEVSKELPKNAKIEKDEKQSFEDYKTMYKDVITQKCIEDYGVDTDTKLWEDTAKELYLKSKTYIPTGEEKSEEVLVKKEESKSLKENKNPEDLTTIEEIEEYINNIQDEHTKKILHYILEDEKQQENPNIGYLTMAIRKVSEVENSREKKTEDFNNNTKFLAHILNGVIKDIQSRFDVEAIAEFTKDEDEIVIYIRGNTLDLIDATSYLAKTIRRDDVDFEFDENISDNTIKCIVSRKNKMESLQENNTNLEYNYMLLDRLKTDCEYFLGNGNGYEKHLWAGDIDSQIAKMKELYNSFADDEKPEWITIDDINNYEKEMKELKNGKEKKTESMSDDWYNTMYDKYVPNTGEASTIGGEILRTFSGISRMFYQNGDKIWRGNMRNNSYVLDPLADKLDDLLPQEGKDLMSKMANSTTDNAYEKRLNVLEDYVYNYLKDNDNLFGNDKDKKEETVISNYTLNEIKKVINSNGNDFTIKIVNSDEDVQTKTLNIDREDLISIYNTLGGNKDFITESRPDKDRARAAAFTGSRRRLQLPANGLNEEAEIIEYLKKCKNQIDIMNVNDAIKNTELRNKLLTTGFDFAKGVNIVDDHIDEFKNIMIKATQDYFQTIKTESKEGYQDKCCMCGTSNLNGCYSVLDEEGNVGSVCQDCGKKYSLPEIKKKINLGVKSESKVNLKEDQYESERRGKPSIKKIAKDEYYDNQDWYIQHIKDYVDEDDFIKKEIAEIAQEYSLKEDSARNVCKEIYKLAKDNGLLK